jgi:hypothetical protein
VILLQPQPLALPKPDETVYCCTGIITSPAAIVLAYFATRLTGAEIGRIQRYGHLLRFSNPEYQRLFDFANPQNAFWSGHQS